MATPLKLQGTNGDLQEMSTTEENYLAYRAGIHLSNATTNSVWTLNDGTLSGTHQTVGQYSDTVYDDAVGTHGTTLTETTTNTTLKQRKGTASEDNGNFRYPIKFDSTNDNIHEMTDAELNTVVDRISSRIFTSDYPGTYRLGSSSPGSDYDTHLSSVFSDTRTDGTTVNYNIYQRQSMPAVTTVLPVAIKRDGGDSGNYEGLQEMTQTQVTYTFGQRVKTRAMSSDNGVGSYLLLSSTAGNPNANGYSGTWVAKGTATDTKQEVSAVSYTRGRQSNYSRNFEGNYCRDFVANYNRGFVGNYSRAFAGVIMSLPLLVIIQEPLWVIMFQIISETTLETL